MKKLIQRLPAIRFNKYTYLVIIILFILLLGGLQWQRNGGLKIGSNMLLMSNYDKQVELSTGDRAKYEAAVQKYDNLLNNFAAGEGQDPGKWTNKELERFLNKAENLYNLGENNNAIQIIYKALGYFPNSLPTLDMLGNIYAQVEAYQYALNTYNKILEIDPSQNYTKQIIRMHIGLGHADLAGKLYIDYIKNGGTKDLTIINQIRALRGMNPMQK